ncbi:uncharacterized protein LOC106089647 [Stomoxys calcitrans]|uniref:uncharacterized protein LOC106089647 n=1 Tax=Stomoxys calcitrans TaxID=35570 RepID=UPI0027E2F5DA|nr:uncharacterized protein LOC106089647 [Stomoxys calcitrans]
MNLVKLIEAVKKHKNIYKNLSDTGARSCTKDWQIVAKDLQNAMNCDVTAAEAQDQWNGVLLAYYEYLRGNQDFALAKHMDFLQPYLFTMIDDHINEEELTNIVEDEENVNSTHTNKEPKDETEGYDGNETGDLAQTIRKDPLNDILIKHQIVQPMEERVEKPKDSAKNDIVITESSAEDSEKGVLLPSDKASAAQQQQTDVNTEKAKDTIEKPSVYPEKIIAAPRNTSSQNDSSFSNLSSMELIFLGYAKQLQKMPLKLQLKTKRKIADIMEDAELAMMEEA